MLRNIKNHFINILGKTTGLKIVVFVSDDWGSIRTSSNNSLNKLLANGIDVNRCHYMLNDALASESDLLYLFESLRKYKDKHGQNPIITANSLVANPDFFKIRNSGFKKYYWESFIDTLKRYPEHGKSFKLWQEGISENLFYPQSHGREHLNITRWMSDLREENPETRLAFDLEMFGLSAHTVKNQRKSYQAAFDLDSEKTTYDRELVIDEALELFKKTFGYSSKSFIAPNYIWDDDIELALNRNGVKYIQCSTAQRKPQFDNGLYTIVRHYQGQLNKLGQRYILRNAHFEPSSNPAKDWVDTCMKEISTAFLWNKPAVISTHRVNFIGYINPYNRDRNLKEFDRLLHSIIRTWPDVEFKTADQLGDLMNKKI